MSAINKLSDTFIRKLAASPTLKKYGDGDKLWIVVNPSGSKIWRVFWKDDGKQKQFTIGPYPAISLKAARQERDRINTLLAHGLDPNDQKKWEGEKEAHKQAENALTFQKVALEWHEKRTTLQSENSRNIKLQRLRKHVFPYIGHIAFSQLKLSDIITALHYIEETGHLEMAKRVHILISHICKYARIKSHVPPAKPGA